MFPFSQKSLLATEWRLKMWQAQKMSNGPSNMSTVVIWSFSAKASRSSLKLDDMILLLTRHLLYERKKKKSIREIEKNGEDAKINLIDYKTIQKYVDDSLEKQVRQENTDFVIDKQIFHA